MNIHEVMRLLRGLPYGVAEKDMMTDVDLIIITQPWPVSRVLAHRDELQAAIGDGWEIRRRKGGRTGRISVDIQAVR